MHEWYPPSGRYHTLVWYNYYISLSWHFAAVLPASFTAIKECFCSVSLGACFSTNTERCMIDFECWQQSTLLNFTSREWQSTRTGRLRWRGTHPPTSSDHCGRPSRSDGYSDRPPTFQRLVRAAKHTTAPNQAESKMITLYRVLDLRFITPQISPSCPGNVIYDVFATW